ncbi:histidine kinase [Planotetraspora sp. GP83]|uniref:sensor histidine kinase n=1 Tax=Planotetraspora sp. GP83 TaxID=3156264 RepID=UPI0035195C15
MRSPVPRDMPLVVVVTLLTLAAVTWANVASWGVGPPSPLWVDLAYHGFGYPLIIAGAILWARGARSRVGVLLLVLGTVYYLSFLRVSENEALFAVGFSLAYLYVGVFAHLVFSVPSGRLRGRIDRAYVTASYLACVGTQVGRYLTDHPEAPWNYNIGQVNTRWAIAGSLVLAALGVAGIAIVLRRLLIALAVRRRRTGPVWATFIAVGVLLIASALASATGRALSTQLSVGVLMLGGAAVGIVVAYLVSIGMQWRRELRIAELPARLGELRAPPLMALQTALAEAVGDPTLRLLLAGGDGALVALSGERVGGDQAPARTLTPIVRGADVLGIVEHDAALTETGRATASAIALTGLVMENMRLYTQVRDSRRRLLEAELAERRRIERDLHDGAQQGFFVVLTLLGLAQKQAEAAGSPGAELLADAKSQLTDAINALRELAQGLHPRSLIEHGLRETVAELARRHPGQLRYDIVNRRWPRDVESTVYFVIAEGVTNALKHAGPGAAIDVQVTSDGDGLVVTVTDNGAGGANLSGGGLRGLTERVAAAGGELTVESPEEGGTRLVARLPGEFPGDREGEQ